jgi:hypothetical protein
MKPLSNAKRWKKECRTTVSKIWEGWMAIHEDELYANWQMLKEGEGFFKIEPLR